MDDLQPQATLSKTEQNTGAIISMLAITVLLIYITFAILGVDSEATILAAIAITLLSATCLCAAVLIKYRRQNNPFMVDYLNIGTQRYILAILMIFYGTNKLLGNFFDYQLFALDSKLVDVSEFQLAWFFYGKSPWQELFTGIMEFVPAVFLFSRRTYYVAAIVLLPVTAQVFLLNLFFKIGGITFPVSAVLLACNAYIIYSQREKIVLFFRSLNFTIASVPASGAKTIVKVLKVGGIFLACMMVLLQVRPVIFHSAGEKKYQALVGVYNMKNMKKNGVEYTPANDSLYYQDLYIEKQARWNILRKYNKETEAFILKLNTHNDSVRLYLNKGGIGDDPDIIDSATVLKGIYKLDGKYLTLKGVQMKDTLEMTYERVDRIKPKKWFW